MTRKKAFVEVKVGTVNGVPTVRAVARKLGSDWRNGGAMIAAVEMTVERPNEWKSRKGNYGRLYFHILQELKARLQQQTMCKCCEHGSVYYSKLNQHGSSSNGQYLATWDCRQINENGICEHCERWLHPTKAIFNPVPELDDDGMPYDTIFADCVTELARPSREALLEDIEYLYALDTHEVSSFFSG